MLPYGLLTWWAGIFYLLQKVGLLCTELSGKSLRGLKFRIAAWTVYIAGLPAWLFIFADKDRWIAFGVEAGGAPAMVLGLVRALRDYRHLKRKLLRGEEVALFTPRWLKVLDLVSCTIAVAIGLGYSIAIFGGLTTQNQWLEIGLATGFLAGTYLLATERPSGYLWYLLMNGSTALLMKNQGHPELFWQQVASMGFIALAYITNRWRRG
jgi:hypothetical protein